MKNIVLVHFDTPIPPPKKKNSGSMFYVLINTNYIYVTENKC